MAGPTATLGARPAAGRIGGNIGKPQGSFGRVEGGRFSVETGGIGSKQTFSSRVLGQERYRHPAGIKASVAEAKHTVLKGRPVRESGLGKAYIPDVRRMGSPIPESQNLTNPLRTRREQSFNPLTLPEFSIHTAPKPDTSRIKVKELPNGKIQIDSPGKARAREIMADLQHNFVLVRKPESKPAVEINPRTKPVVDVPVLAPAARQDAVINRIRILESSPIKVQTIKPENTPVVLESADIPTVKKPAAQRRTFLRNAAIYPALLVGRLKQQEDSRQDGETDDKKKSLLQLVKQKAAGLTAVKPKVLEQVQAQTLPSVKTALMTVPTVRPEARPALAISSKVAVDTKPQSAVGYGLSGDTPKPPPPVDDASRRNQTVVSVDERAVAVRIRTMVNGIETAAQLTGKKTVVDGNIAARFTNLYTKEARSGLLEQLRIGVHDGTIGETFKKFTSKRFYLPTVEESVRKIVETFRPAVLSRGRYITKEEVLLVTGGKDPDAK